MRFTKMHGLGNDYVYMDCVNGPTPTDPVKTSIAVSDRHFGIGSDGLILIMKSDVADVRMRMFNADGSESEMCGNGLRCVAKFVYDHGIKRSPKLAIETGRGVLTVELMITNDTVSQVTVNMGEPILDPSKIPTTITGINEPVAISGGAAIALTAVSMGNPHAVAFVDAITDDHVHRIGPLLEKHEAFPKRANIEFVKIHSKHEATMRVWERGSGETLACGTGACAVLVAGVLTGRLDRQATIHLLGGDLKIHWNETDNCVYKTGPATEVFTGEWRERSP
jgi:diaminopimelate epimerase